MQAAQSRQRAKMHVAPTLLRYLSALPFGSCLDLNGT